MIESILILYLAIAAALIIVGFYGKSPSFVTLSGIMFILLGAIFMTGDELELNKVEDLNKFGNNYKVTYQTIDNTDPMLLTFQWLFFGLGFSFIAIAFYFYWARTRGATTEEFGGEE